LHTLTAIPVACCFLAGFLSSLYGAEAIAGSVKTVQGRAQLQRGAASTALQEGMHLLPNDMLRIAADGYAGVILQDGTRLALGPNTELRIDQFIYQPAEGKFAMVLRLTRGILAYVSGKIAQFSPGSIRVETPVGIVGLRGTQFAVTLEGL
jgi:hypothetical protein